MVFASQGLQDSARRFNAGNIRSVVGCRLSVVVGCRLAVVSGQWSVVGGRLAVGSWQFSVRSKRYGQDGLCTAGAAGLSPAFQRREHPISCQLAVVGCQGEFEVR